jgi:hypothetical protein
MRKKKTENRKQKTGQLASKKITSKAKRSFLVCRTIRGHNNPGKPGRLASRLQLLNSEFCFLNSFLVICKIFVVCGFKLAWLRARWGRRGMNPGYQTNRPIEPLRRGLRGKAYRPVG